MISRKISTNESSASLLVLPVWILAVYALGLLMGEAATIFLWIVCAFFLFVILDPAAEFLKARGWKPAWAGILLVLLATLITAGILYVLGYLFSGMVVELENSRQLFLKAFNSMNASWNSWWTNFSAIKVTDAQATSDVTKVEIVKGSPFGGELGGTILHGLGSAVTIMTFAVLVPVLAFFMLAERDSIAKVLGRAYLERETGRQAWARIVRSTRAFFVGNLVLGLITYPVFILIFKLFSVPSIFTVAALATFFNLVPFAGAVLAGFLPAVALYTADQSVGEALSLYSCCIALHFIVADFITPKLLGSQVNINATTSTVALVAWGQLWGGVGLILAIPLTSLIKILFEHSNFFWLQWIAGLMSENIDESLRPTEVTAEAAPLI